jgi:hypothetical protein
VSFGQLLQCRHTQEGNVARKHHQDSPFSAQERLRLLQRVRCAQLLLLKGKSQTPTVSHLCAHHFGPMTDDNGDGLGRDRLGRPQHMLQ